jgi:arginine-tRNA-protein transferase
MNRRQIDLFVTEPHPCGYLPDRQARTLLVDPALAVRPPTYGMLLERGFRRSGATVYRPACETCQACIPVRVPVAGFTPDAGQRRIWRKNRDVVTRFVSPGSSPEHHALFRRYVATRHAGGEMDRDDEGEFPGFLVSPHITTTFMELRGPAEQLIGVAVVDLVPGALSAVYTFFDPAEGRRSPGVLAVLLEIEKARELGLSHVYLGYWISACRKMSYKDEYRPFEAFVNGAWTPGGGS